MPEVQSTREGKLQRTWDPWKMFNVSAEELEMMKKRKKLAALKKVEYRMIKYDPTAIVNGRGHIVDLQLQRWEAARATYGDHFRISRRNTSFLFFSYILPVVAMYKIADYMMQKRDEKSRSGEVSTKDRSKRAFLFM